MILPDPADPELVAGTVTLWSHDTGEGPLSGIGRMVLPEFQGLGLGQGWAGARSALCRNRLGTRTAGGSCTPFRPPATPPRTGSCRSVGFRFCLRFVSVTDVTFAGRTVRAEHRSVAPANDPT